MCTLVCNRVGLSPSGIETIRMYSIRIVSPYGDALLSSSIPLTTTVDACSKAQIITLLYKRPNKDGWVK